MRCRAGTIWYGVPEDKRLEMIDTIKKHFPNLRMLVRAKNRFDAYDQMNAGMLHIYRETIDTALRLGVDTMTMLGHRRYSAQRAARLFFKYDESFLKQLSAIKDPDEHTTAARAYIEEIEKMMQADAGGLSLSRDAGWDEDSLMAEVRGGAFPEKVTTDN